MNRSAFLAIIPLGLSLFACGSSGGTDATGGTSASGSASSTGGNATGGAPTGGASSGGAGSGGDASGGSSSGGSTSGGHCTPGVTEDGAFVYPYPIDNCGEPSNWSGDADLSFRDVSLEKPIGPGDTYAFSASVVFNGGRFAVYGATEKCGDVGELLSDVTVVGDEIVCHAISPKTGTYSHLIWVWYSGGSQSETTFCESGTCPN